MTSWTGGPARRIVTFQVADPRPTTGSTSWRGSGRRTASPTYPARIRLSSCRPSPQGASCRSWAVRRIDPPARASASRRAAEGLDRGRDPGFHVRRPAPGNAAIGDPGRHERQVYGVEMAVELKSPTRTTASEPDGHRARLGVAAVGPFDRETLTSEDLGEHVAHRARLAGPARHVDQPDGGLDQPLRVDTCDEVFVGRCHGRPAREAPARARPAG